jgi:hypothetical protein
MITYHKDLSPIAYLQKRTVHAHDGTPEFEADIRLMLKNCYTFNTTHPRYAHDGKSAGGSLSGDVVREAVLCHVTGGDSDDHMWETEV